MMTNIQEKFTYKSTSCCQKRNGTQHTTINMKKQSAKEFGFIRKKTFS
jgi:hypothetical protein